MAEKDHIASSEIFSRKITNKIFIYLLGRPFHSEKIFQAKNDPFVMNKIFLVQTIIITFIYLLALFIAHCVKLLENSYSRSRDMRMYYFWDQNGPFAQMRIFFFRKSVNKPCSFHSRLSKFPKIKARY